MNLEELQDKSIEYGSHEYSLFIEDYEDEINKLSHEDRFFLLKDLYIGAKEGNELSAELLQYEIEDVRGGVPEKEIDNIKNNIKFNTNGEVIVYRGLNKFNDKYGCSYTLDKNMALWFSKRFGENPKIIEITVKLKDIIFYDNSRGEQEVFLNEIAVINKVGCWH